MAFANRSGGSYSFATANGLSPAARSMWAKSDYIDGVEWLPLYQHMADSSAVALHLWDEFVPSSMKRTVAESLDGDEGLARRFFGWLVAAHDLGKATPAFAWQVEGLRLRIENHGLPFHPAIRRDRSALPHSVATYLILRAYLMDVHRFTRKDAARVASIPLGHHGRFTRPRSEVEDGHPALLGTGTSWEQVQREFCEFATSSAGMSDDDFARIAGITMSQTTAIIAAGFTIMADWIASNTENFPLRTTPRPAEAADDAMNRLGLPPPWSADAPGDEHLFVDHLGLSAPRPVQTALVNLARTLPQPELIIVEAPTGEGKTKAALGACEVLATRFDLGGVLFALPTQATSDGIFQNVREWLDTIQGPQNVSLSLAHGKAQFNEDFRSTPRMSSVFDDNGEDGRAIAHSFLTGRSKLATMSDFVVGTVDQLLLGALCAKHVVLRHLGVAGKAVVIDEVHSADQFMRQYLCRMLTWLAAYGVPVIAMSATLTPSIREELITAYNDGLDRSPRFDAEQPDGATYPRITHTCDDGSTTIALSASGRSSTLTINELPGTVDDIAAAALAAAVPGANVAIVCDTVGRAQDTYRRLRDTAGADVEVTLLHSRFLTPDRMSKEQNLRRRLGPDATDRSGKIPLIVVATQVIEQSLDIDFDVILTDIAPIDLLIQRAGRLHRHGWKDADRPNAHSTPRLILTGFTRSEAGPPDFDPGCRAVYGESALLRTIATLDEHLGTHPGITSPDHVANLVARAYESIEAPTGWEERWATAQEKAGVLLADKRRRADMFLIPPPTKRSLVGWAITEAPNDPTGERGIAQVRDSEDTIEVVVIQTVNGHRIIPCWATTMPREEVDLTGGLDPAVARAAAMNTLRLPGFFAYPRIGDALIDELEQNCVDSWQNSPWLRGALPLVLDEDGDAEHVGYLFHYDTDLGLVVTDLEKQ